MSKRNRTKFRDRAEREALVSSVQSSPIMNRANGDAATQHAAEYKIISKDMIRLVALNGFMLAAVIVVYYTNKSSGYLERIYSNLF